ncbi:hypothetical protein INS49_004114 [Diaporthe citri]|uniref:uncharacterized protein n=1 Tax=Diaporthe citri TaxID=83186 RepID=UPI001C81EEA8|nr:uncharacterized protein INS49_004114 [Diaporthe citri]KAG6355033.1 hypothetical protein INS49_004114 [Diaporthe citri]
MDAALDQVKQLASNIDASARQKLTLELMKVIHSLETPDDMLQRIGSLHFQTAAVILGYDLSVFRNLCKSESSNVEELARESGAEPALLGRILRYLASVGLVDEVSKDVFAANHATRTLSEEVSEAGLKHYFYTCSPIHQSLPEHLKSTGYKSPEDETNTAFNKAFGTDKHVFFWFGGQAERLKYFNDYMALRRTPDVSWLSVYPVIEEAKGVTADRAVFVNVGGGIGHQCAEFKRAHPGIPGRVVLQDLQHSIDAALPTPGVENTVHNFFEKQPVEGAKFYFLRGVFHNHPTHKVQLLLSNIKAVMAPDSVILIDEIVTPEVGVNHDAMAHDLTMMATFAGAERSEAQWRDILDAVGLKLVKTYVYNPSGYETVLDVRAA